MHKWAGVGIGRARTAGKDGHFTACHPQVATAQIRYATIRVYRLLADDVIDKRFEVRRMLSVLAGPGLGRKRSSSTKPDGTGVREGDLVW